MAFQRKLVALMFTDIVGYSRMTERNELKTHEMLREHNRIVRDCIRQFGGQEIRTIGDAFFIEFPSAVQSVECAVEIQQNFYTLNQTLSHQLQFQLRIGIHLGDVLINEQESYGNEVNIAARVQSLATPGAICVSDAVFHQVQGKTKYAFKKIGTPPMKNIAQSVSIYEAILPWQKTKKLNLKQAFSIKNWLRPAPLSMAILALSVSIVLSSVVVEWISKISLDPLPQVFLAQTRGPSGTSSPQSLSSDWEINVNPRKENLWISYDSKSRSQWLSKIQGEYWLRRSLVLNTQFHEPAIVLGTIPDRHRVYLDETLIGANDHIQPIAYYIVDPKMISPGKKHTLLIRAHTDGSLIPGLNIAPSVGAWIGETSEISQKLDFDFKAYHFPRIAGLVISLVFFFATLLFAILNLKHRELFYTFIYSGAVCLSMMYQNHILLDHLPFYIDTWIRLLSVGILSPILVSASFVQNGKSKYEIINNAIAILFGVASYVVITSSRVASPELMQSINLFYFMSTLYCFWALSRGGVTTALSIMHMVFSLYSIRGQFMPHFLDALRPVINAMFIAQPLIFSFGMLALFLRNDSIRASRQRQQTALDEMIQDLIPSGQSMTILHSALTAHLNCRFSGIYSVQKDKMSYRYECLSYEPRTAGDPTQLYADSTRPLLNQVMEQKRTIKIDRMNDRTNEKRNQFETDACMVIPIWNGSEIVGIATFADPIGRDRFNDIDLKAAIIAAQFLFLKAQIKTSNTTPLPKAA